MLILAGNDSKIGKKASQATQLNRRPETGNQYINTLAYNSSATSSENFLATAFADCFHDFLPFLPFDSISDAPV